MAFDFAERSHESAAPIELYRFSIADPSVPGGVDVYGYTNAEYPVSWSGVTYQPAPLKRDPIKITGALDKSQLAITMSATTDIADLLQNAAPSGICNLTIYRVHTTDKYNEARQWWTGRITNYSRKYGEASLLGESNVTSLARPGLRRNYQYQCPLQLYGPICQAKKVLYNFNSANNSGGYSSISALFVDNAALFTDLDTFRNGTIAWIDSLGKTQTRWVISVAVSAPTTGANSGNTVYTFTTSGSTSTIKTNTPLSLAPGCSKTRNICRDRFNNIDNFGGQPFIPSSNPNGNTSPFI